MGKKHKISKKELEILHDWIVQYIIKRDDKWEKKEKDLLSTGISKNNVADDKLCYNATSFHTVWKKLSELNIEESIDDFSLHKLKIRGM